MIEATLSQASGATQSRYPARITMPEKMPIESFLKLDNKVTLALLSLS